MDSGAVVDERDERGRLPAGLSRASGYFAVTCSAQLFASLWPLRNGSVVAARRGEAKIS